MCFTKLSYTINVFYKCANYVKKYYLFNKTYFKFVFFTLLGEKAHEFIFINCLVYATECLQYAGLYCVYVTKNGLHYEWAVMPTNRKSEMLRLAYTF